MHDSQKALDARARRAARRIGLIARKSRRVNRDNAGGYMLLDPNNMFPVAGFNYDMDAVEVISYCGD